MNRPHLRRSGAVAATCAIAAFALAAATIDPASAGSAPPPPAHTAKPWRDAGRLIGPGHDWPTIATSNSGVLAAVATSGGTVQNPKPTLVVRRLPDGTVSKDKKVLGLTTGVSVDQNGNILVVAQRGDDLLATSWPRTAQRPTTQKVIDGRSIPRFAYAELLANARGDAVIAVRTTTGAMVLKRRFADDRAWRPRIKVGSNEYGATPDDVALTRTGRLVGAFRHDMTVSLRNLTRGSRTFGPARQVINWPGAENDFPGAYEVTASVTVGPQDDLVASLSFAIQRGDGKASARRSDNAYYFRYMIKPVGDRRYRGQIDDSEWITFDRPVVAADGSVTVSRGLTMMRWTPDRWRSISNAWFHAKSPRGDVLVGSAAYRGTVHVWPVGKGQQPARAVPPGYARAWAMSNNFRTYVVSQRGTTRPSFHLSIGTLPH